MDAGAQRVECPFFLFPFALVCLLADYTPEALADQVDWAALPGAENLAVKGSFNQFAGYINIDEKNGRRIFYWFFEAQENAKDAPVVRTCCVRCVIRTLCSVFQG